MVGGGVGCNVETQDACCLTVEMGLRSELGIAFAYLRWIPLGLIERVVVPDEKIPGCRGRPHRTMLPMQVASNHIHATVDLCDHELLVENFRIGASS